MKARANAANLMAAAGVASDADNVADNNNESDSDDDSYDGGSIGSWKIKEAEETKKQR